MKIQFRSKPTVRLHGYSPEIPEKILTRIQHGAKPSSLKGDFILVAEGNDAETGKPLTVFVSTVVAATPYFLYLTDSHCVHSTNVIDCCRCAGLNWQWNWDALAQLALFDHVLGNASLHRDIIRVPQGSIVKVCGKMLEEFADPFWTELYETRESTGKQPEASSVLLDILSELPAGRRYSLSLSAGYDSRALLAGMSYLNRSIETASMGAPDSTDPRIANQLAQAAGCDFKRIEINADDYVLHADEILKTTSGEKLFWHWHTGIYTKKVGFNPAAIHLAGSNGEFARSYFFNKGFIASLMDCTGFSRSDWWLIAKNSCRRRVAPEILAAIRPQSDLIARLNAGQQIKRGFIPGLRFGDGLDCFYTKERVRNFVGLGLALYRSEFPTMSPFLDVRFIRYAARLGRHDKLANRMHRAIVEKLRPEFLKFPTDESGVPMTSDSGHFYFLKRSRTKEYSRYGVAQNLPHVINWARLGFCELGGEAKLLDGDIRLGAQVKRWNLAITIGAFLETLRKNGIKKD